MAREDEIINSLFMLSISLIQRIELYKKSKRFLLLKLTISLNIGKTSRVAVDAGYDKAFVTILDSNITTLIAAVFLFQFGTGPIKGFAVTLTIGLCISMFTAIVVTKLIYDFLFRENFLSKIKI